MEENVRRFFVHFYLKHCKEHFTNIGNFKEIDFGNNFGSMETILKALNILCYFPNYITSMLNFKIFKE
jgi:hypothetical protein